MRSIRAKVHGSLISLLALPKRFLIYEYLPVCNSEATNKTQKNIEQIHCATLKVSHLSICLTKVRLFHQIELI